MGSGYVRQSSANIAANQPVASAPINAEYNALAAAFSGAGGHAHDGSTGNGPVLESSALGITTTTPGIVALTGTLGAFTPVTITGTTGQIDVSNGTGATGNPTISIDPAYVGQTSITTLGTITTGTWTGTTIAAAYGGTGTTTSTGTGSVVLSASPTFTGTVNGSALSFTAGGFGSLNVVGATTLAGVSTSGNTSIGGTLGVTGATALSSTLAVTGASTLSGNTTVGGTLGVTGNATLSGTLNSGAATLSSASVTGNATVGGTFGVTGNTTLSGTLSAGSSTLNSAIVNTTLGVTGNSTLGGTLGVTGNTTIGGTLSVTGNVTMPTQTAGDSSTKGATTAFVNGTALTLSAGTTATTQTAGDSTTKVATTAFVNGTALTLASGTAAVTQSRGDGSTKVATTAYVDRLDKGASYIFIGTATISNTRAVFFTNLPTGYDQFELRFTNVIAQSGTPGGLGITLSSDNGTTWKTANYQYSSLTTNWGGTVTGEGSVSFGYFPIGDPVGTYLDTTYPSYGVVTLYNLTSSGTYKAYSHKSVYFASGGAGNGQFDGGGVYTGDTSVVNAVRFGTSGDGMASGVVSLYAIRNS